MRFRRILIFTPVASRGDDASDALIAGLRERDSGAVIDRALPDGRIVSSTDEGTLAGEVPREALHADGIARSGLFSAVRGARRGQYDLAIGLDRSLRAALIPVLAGIPFRIGPGSRAGRFLYSLAVPFDGREGPRGRVGRILAVLDPHVVAPQSVRPENAAGC